METKNEREKHQQQKWIYQKIKKIKGRNRNVCREEKEENEEEEEEVHRIQKYERDNRQKE